MSKVITTQLNMSNDYFKAQGWFKNYARNSQDSRGMFQRLVKEDEEAFRLASAETDKIKAMMNKKYGPGSVKYGSEIKQPEMKIPQAIFEFTQRNPAAEGGQMVKPSDDGSRPGYSGKEAPKVDNPKIKIFQHKSQDGKKYTGQPYVRDATKKKELPPNTVRRGEKIIFLGDNAMANAEAFSQTFGTRGGDINELKRLIDEANDGFKYVRLKDLQVKAGYSKNTAAFSPNEKIYGSLETMEDKAKKAFDYIFSDPDKLVVDMFDPMSQVKKLIGMSDKNAVGPFLKGYEPYESQKLLIKTLAVPKSKTKLRKAEGLTLGDLEFRIDNNVKGDVLFAPPKQVSPETKIFDIVDRHIKQGGTKIEWTVKPEITPGGSTSYGEARFKYNGKEYGMGELINDAKDDPNFKEFFKAQKEYKTINDKIVKHPKTGEKIRFGNLMKEVYGDSVVPYNVDHYKSILDEPFTSLRVLPRRINTAAGNIKSFDEMDITKPELAGKYSDAGKEMQLKKIGYNYNQSIDDLIEAELKLADDVLNKGRVLRKPNEIVESIRKGENYVPDFYSKDAKPGKGFEKVVPNIDKIEAYITEMTGKVKQPMLSSGFSGAFEMLSDDLKPVLNNPKFKAFAKTVVNTPGKFFGIGDVVLGFLDYQNNLGHGMSKERARKLAYQAMSFGAWRVGDQEYIKELKDTYLKQGGDESVFDQVINLNKQNADLMQTVENTKKNYKKNLENEKAFGNTIGNVGLKYQIDLPTASEQLKLDLNSIKSKAENMDKNFTTFKETYTGEDLTKPSKDIKSAAFENLTKERLKAFDEKSLQSKPEDGRVWNYLRSNILNTQSIPRTLTTAVDLINPFTPLPKLDDLRSDRARYEAQLKEMKEKYPREFYLHNLRRGMDRDNPITVEAAANLAAKPELGINFSEGGITGLRSKYEYKK